jgi:hypothetical protein
MAHILWSLFLFRCFKTRSRLGLILSRNKNPEAIPFNSPCSVSNVNIHAFSLLTSPRLASLSVSFSQRESLVLVKSVQLSMIQHTFPPFDLSVLCAIASSQDGMDWVGQALPDVVALCYVTRFNFLTWSMFGRGIQCNSPVYWKAWFQTSRKTGSSAEPYLRLKKLRLFMKNRDTKKKKKEKIQRHCLKRSYGIFLLLQEVTMSF